jgi:tetratricopeptide (TPR) repeat protein/membrane protease YdiL (CAAX protease family)
MRVVAQSDGTCPSCGKPIFGVSDESIDAPRESRPTPIVESETIASLQVRLLKSFDAAWRDGTPQLADFVALIPNDFVDDNARRQLLIELIRRDIEYRRGPARLTSTTENSPSIAVDQPTKLTLEDYSCQFPELRSDGALPARLKVAEFLARSAAGEKVRLEEYLEPGSNRSSELAAQLANEFIILAPSRPTACASLWASLGACSVLLFAQIFTATYQEAFEMTGLSSPSAITFSLSALSVFIVGFLILDTVHGRDSRRVVGFRPSAGFHTLLVLLLVLPTVIVVSSVVNFFFYDPRPPLVSSIDFSQLDSLYAELAMEHWGLLIIVGCIAPAISEELFFRGLLGRGLIRGHGVVLGVLMTSILFGLFHLDPSRILATFMLGSVLHIVFLTTKSIVAPMLLHALNNLVVFTESRYVQLGWIDPTQGDGIEYISPALFVSSIFAVLILLIVLRKTSTKWILVDSIQWSAGFVSAESPPAMVPARILRTKCGRWLGVACIVSCLVFAASLGLTVISWTALTYANQAMISADADDFDTADQLSKRAIKVGPNLAWPHACSAWVRLRSGGLNEALAACDRSLELDSTIAFAYVIRAMVMVDQQKFDSALSDCDRAMRLRRFSFELEAYSTRAAAWLGKNQPEKAVEDANAALRLSPNDSAALSHRGCAYVQLGKYSLAIDDLTRAIELVPSDSYSLTWRAIACWESDDSLGTIADSTRALEVDPQNTSALYHRAMAYERQQLLENAYTDLSTCIGIDGEDSGSTLARGKLLLKMDKPLEAVADFSALILRFPRDWEIRKFAAEAYRQAGDLQRAENEEKVARKLQIAEYVQLGWQDIESGNHAHALTRIDGALVEFPDTPSLFHIQAVARVQLQEYDAAIQSYTSALAIDSNDAILLLERGKLYLEKRAVTLALADFDRSILLNPNIGEAYFSRAIAHQELGNKEKSEADLKTLDELQAMSIP